MNIKCLFGKHDWRSLSNNHRKCIRCKKFQAKDYWGQWTNYKPKVKVFTPVNDREV